MSQADELLIKLGMKYEDLNSSERDTYHAMLENLRQNTLTVEVIKEHIVAMRESVEDELTAYDNGKTKDIFLKARLKNYKLLESFMLSPERAEKALEKSLKGASR